MATVNGKTFAVQHGVLRTTWVLGDADVGTPDQLSRYPLHSVQFAGTWGGATVVLQGSDDGVTYFTLPGKLATGAEGPISAVADARFDFEAVPMHIRPSSSGGTAAAVTVIVTSRNTSS